MDRRRRWRPDRCCTTLCGLASGGWTRPARALGSVWQASDSSPRVTSERRSRFPPDTGYRLRSTDSWNLLVDLMNHSTTSSKTVYVKVTYTYRPSSESVKRLKPVWLDIDQCGDSQYSIPAGYSDTHRNWKVNVPGKVVAMLGHVHGHGIAVEATNER